MMKKRDRGGLEENDSVAFITISVTNDANSLLILDSVNNSQNMKTLCVQVYSNWNTSVSSEFGLLEA